MTQITRTFDSAAQAKTALAELKQRGFHQVELIELPDRRGPNGGGAVVRVEPPFGSALAATAILDRHGGKESAPGAANPEPAASPLQQPAKADTQPLSGGAKQAPSPAKTAAPRTAAPQERRQELRSGPSTLSEWLGIPVLIDSNTYFSGFPLLLRPSRKAPAAKSE
ncbi:hypothetical protein BJ123_104151 [Rhodopseudomonas thermotolerans]|uniref:Uncharacterized protein n=2 Tax=Rhodopseudomonas TaxID=1073 RepID=A0A336JM11_9BRAD|nr:MULTISPECIES: hypothetical protein [Rhodopseudomonas]RED38400.1 hypothetical protein BJ125_104151 [Rhodopseudomonas pentothenatexigens]REG05985.1 hypothetical protein BJ123_104151 [Rhodopseudomonas thermotolerans]SSW89853.1 hypothetical protein SAMN05892882_104151 [Rhodopseudomonas pentothenatexigens]